MRIAYAIPVRHVETLKNGTLAAMGIETRAVTVRSFPEQVRISLVVALAVPHVEAQPGVEHQLRARVLGPDLAEVAPAISATVQLKAGAATPEGWEVRSTVPVAIGFPATQEGAHSVELATDSHTLDVPILVRGPAPA